MAPNLLETLKLGKQIGGIMRLCGRLLNTLTLLLALLLPIILAHAEPCSAGLERKLSALNQEQAKLKKDYVNSPGGTERAQALLGKTQELGRKQGEILKQLGLTQGIEKARSTDWSHAGVQKLASFDTKTVEGQMGRLAFVELADSVTVRSEESGHPEDPLTVRVRILKELHDAFNRGHFCLTGVAEELKVLSNHLENKAPVTLPLSAPAQDGGSTGEATL